MSHDAVIIGAGHNGLAAGVILAKAGWSVLVLERNAEAGGAVRTAEVTLPGYRHDLFAANLNLFAGSPFYAEFGEELHRHGLDFAPTSKPFSSIFPGGKFVGISTDQDDTKASIARLSGADVSAWESLEADFQRGAQHMFPLLGDPLPSFSAVRHLFAGARALGWGWPGEITRLTLQSTREFAEEHFESPEMRSAYAVWGMHLDYPPDVSGGALFPYLETFADAANGMVLGMGGASNMIDALQSLLEAHGGEVRFASPVAEIHVKGKKASGVILEGGETISANKAVIANLTPRILFENLIPADKLDESFRAKVSKYRHGPGTMMIHLAASDLPTWSNPLARDYAYVHIAPYLEDMSRAYHEASAGLLPTTPTLVVGQPTAVDSSRAPDGNHVLWIQVRVVPSQIKGDAAAVISGTDWQDVKEEYADRVVDIIESYAPGIRDRVLARHVLSPVDLENANPNLVGGDSLGGSHHLMQHFFLRPFPGWTRYRTPIRDLYMCGAGTWPGAGVGAGSGYLLGKMLTKPAMTDRLKSLFRRR